MKTLLKSLMITLVMSLVWFKTTDVNSQTTYCERMGVTEKDTGIVYCIGMGYTTCVVPCSNQ